MRVQAMAHLWRRALLRAVAPLHFDRGAATSASAVANLHLRLLGRALPCEASSLETELRPLRQKARRADEAEATLQARAMRAMRAVHPMHPCAMRAARAPCPPRARRPPTPRGLAAAAR